MFTVLVYVKSVKQEIDIRITSAAQKGSSFLRRLSFYLYRILPLHRWVVIANHAHGATEADVVG